jgi:ABC-2 type transport system permease protein
MKLLEIFRFELAYQARRVWHLALLRRPGRLAFLSTIQGRSSSPTRATGWTSSQRAVRHRGRHRVRQPDLACGGRGVAGEAAARDVETGMHPLTYTAPVSKAEYLGGRFLAAFALNALILLAVPAGMLLAATRPAWNPRSSVRSGRPPTSRPTASSRCRTPSSPRRSSSRGGAGPPGHRELRRQRAPLLRGLRRDVFVGMQRGAAGPGGAARRLRPRVHHLRPVLGWTPIEKSTRLIGLQGSLLRSRLVWLGIALAVLAFTYALSLRPSYRRAPGGAASRGGGTAHAGPRPPGAPPRRRRGPAARSERTFGFARRTGAPDARRHGGRRSGTIAKSWGGLACWPWSRRSLVAGAAQNMESMGVPLLPTDRVRAHLPDGPLANLPPPPG